MLFNQVCYSASLMLTPQGLLRLMSLHLPKHSLFLIILVFISGTVWKAASGCVFTFRFGVISSKHSSPAETVHAAASTHTTPGGLHARSHAHEQPRQSPKNLHHSRAVVAFHSTGPRAPGAGTHTHSDLQAVVNRGSPAFHSCRKSIGLCRTQHLI